MNYLTEIKAFYDWLETNRLPTPAIVLWHALMHTANKTGWQEEFAVAISTLMIRTGLERRSAERARNRLIQAGLIDVKNRSGNQSAIYRIIPFVRQCDAQTVALGVAQSVALGDVQSVAQSVALGDAINKLNKTKQNKTKQGLNRSSSDSARARFVAPSVDEVAEYCRSRNNTVDAETFVSFYTSKGWKVGDQPMKDWQAAVRTWEKKRGGNPGNVFLDLAKKYEAEGGIVE